MIYFDSSGLNDIIIVLWEKEVGLNWKKCCSASYQPYLWKYYCYIREKNWAEILKNVFYIIKIHKPLTRSSFSIWHKCFLSEILFMAKEQKIMYHIFFLFSDFFSIDWYIYGIWIRIWTDECVNNYRENNLIQYFNLQLDLFMPEKNNPGILKVQKLSYILNFFWKQNWNKREIFLVVTYLMKYMKFFSSLRMGNAVCLMTETLMA